MRIVSFEPVERESPFPVTIALVMVQEMCARMGAVTGKGLADLIRERFGVRWRRVTLGGAQLCGTRARIGGDFGVTGGHRTLGQNLKTRRGLRQFGQQ